MTYYGGLIKQTREQLHLFQKDLSDSGISRVYVSDLESGKTNPTPIKALKIYENFLFQSCLKSIPVKIEFDFLLKKSTLYWTLKNCYESILKLNSFHKGITNLSEKTIENYVSLYQHEDIKRLKYFFFINIAYSYLKIGNNEKSYIFFVSALRLWQYDLKFENLRSYENSLNSFIKLCDSMNSTDYIVDFINCINYFKKDNNLNIDAISYYNLASIEQKRNNFDNALKHINKYIDNISATEFIKLKYNILILKSTILVDLKKYKTGISIIERLLETPENLDNFCYLQGISYSAIKFIINNNLQGYNELLNKSINNLLMIKKIIGVLPIDILIKIGELYYFRKNYSQSYEFYRQAIEANHQNNLSNQHFEIIISSSKTYMKLNKGSELLRLMESVAVEKLTINESIKYYKLLSHIMIKDDFKKHPSLKLIMNNMTN